jgi:hypothetical protein
MPMSVTISISSTLPAVMARMRQLPAEVGAKAMRRALDRTMTTARKEMSDAIYSEFALKKKDINEKLFINKPKVSPGGLQIEARLFSSSKRGRSMNLVRFVVGSRTKNRKRGDIKLRIRRNGGTKTIKGAFLAPSTKGGPMFLAVRLGRTRLPIEPKQVIDIPQMFNTRRINSRVVKKIATTLGVRFEAEARFYLSRLR